MDAFLWWTGVVVWIVAALLGASEIAWLALDKMVQSYRPWKMFWPVMQRMYQERVKATEPPVG